jgi:heme-degrading monooxygenase HmoA
MIRLDHAPPLRHNPPRRRRALQLVGTRPRAWDARPRERSRRKLGAVVAALTLVTGPAPEMANIARMAHEAVEGWLRGYDGYRGVIVFTDQDAERARIITLWETADAEERSRRGRAEMRDRVVATAGMSVAGFELYEVPVCELLPG